MKRTKIVATIGPKSQDPKTLKGLSEAGVNVFRMNKIVNNFFIIKSFFSLQIDKYSTAIKQQIRVYRRRLDNNHFIKTNKTYDFITIKT